MMPTKVAAIWLLLLALVGAVGLCFPAKGQSSHDQHHDAYRTWQMPGSNASCCSAKRNADGAITGDCYQTRAEIRNGNWWALRDSGEWVEVPDSRIVRYSNPDLTGESASLCMSDFAPSNPANVLCFRPPNTGG